MLSDDGQLVLYLDIDESISEEDKANLSETLNEGRKAVQNSFDIAKYTPENSDAWNEAYKKWQDIITKA